MSRVLCAIVLMLSLALFLQAQSPTTKAPKKAGASTPSASVAKTLESKIRQAWQNFKDRKKDAFAAVLTDDNTQVWADGKGVRDKTTSVRDVDNWTLNSYSLSNFNITPLGANAALATYRAKAEGTASGQKFNSNLEVTEVWVKRSGEWKELRYHESEIK